MKAVYKRELFSYFTSPIGYIILAFGLCISGYLFFKVNLQMMSTSSIVNLLSYLSYLLILMVPLMTMHLWSEERKNKTDQLLLTSDVPVSSIILGKYFASITLFGIYVVLMLVYPMIMSAYGTVSWINIIVLYFGFFIMAGSLLAIGLFVSTLTESQIVSALVSFAIILLFVLSNILSTKINLGIIKKLFEWFSVFTRFDNFIQGVVDVSTIIYYITFSALFVFLSVMSIQRKRWN